MKLSSVLLITLISFVSPLWQLQASQEVLERIQRLNWNGIEVIWLQDQRLPIFSTQIYFADGALSDQRFKGKTEFMFNLLSEGSPKYSFDQIADHFEFLASSFSTRVTHEYAVVSFSGLVENLHETAQMVCHLMTEANFPQNRINHRLNRRRSSLENLIRDHGPLASRAFRELSLRGSPFDYPTDGKLDDLEGIDSSHLLAKRKYFEREVFKRVYITGPQDILALKNILKNDCGFYKKENRHHFIREVSYHNVIIDNGPLFYFVEVPQANQAQVRIGRLLNYHEVKDPFAMLLASNFLGGGFTSRLMREVRTSRGLTYSIRSIAAGQRDYGRALISSFTPSPRVVDLLQVIDRVIKESTQSVDKDDFLRARSNLIGSQPFQFESPASLLSQIMLLDHQQRGLEEITHFRQRIEEVTVEQMKQTLGKTFDFSRQVIVVLGEPKVFQKLQEAGMKVVKTHYTDFL